MVLRLVLAPGRAARPPRREPRRSDAAQEPGREAELAGDEEGHDQLPVLRRLQGQGGPQPWRVGHPVRRAVGDVPPGQRVHRQQAARAVEVRGRPDHQLEHVRVGEGRLLQHRLRARSRGRPRSAGGPQLHAGAVVRLDQPEPERAAAAHLQRGREQLPDGDGRVERPEVRVRVPHGRRRQRHALAGQRHSRDRELGDRPARAGVPAGQRREPRQLHGLLRGRHRVEGRDDARPRHPLRPPVGQGAAEHDGVEPGVPEPGAGSVVQRLRHAVHVEQHLAARRRDLRARPVAQDDPARELQPVRRTAQHGHRRLHEPELDRRVGHLPLDRSERRSLRAGQRSQHERVHQRGRRLQPGEPDRGVVGERRRPESQGADHAERRGRDRP